MRRCARWTVAAAIVFLSLPAPAAKLQKFDFFAVKAGTSPLFPPSPETVKVVLKDQRPEPEVLSCSLFGIQGAFGGITPKKPEAVPAAMEAAAKEAVEVLGFKNGDGGHTLEIVVKDIRADMTPMKGMFGALNFIGYAKVDTALRGPDGAELSSNSYRLTSWISMASGKHPVPYMYARFVWEAVARTLLAKLPKDPDEAAVKALVAKYDTTKEDAERTNHLFWMGLLGKPTPGLVDKLLLVFRSEEDQTLYETAALSLARLATPEVRQEILDVAARKKVLKEWDPGDAEEGFTLTYALYLMNEPDLKAKAPKLTRDPERQTELYAFMDSGEIPKRTEKLEKKLAEAKSKLKE